MSAPATARSAPLASLLVEVLTEELPPKALARLARSFGETLAAGLAEDGFLAAGERRRVFATPRRLAVLIPRVRAVAPDRELLVRGPSVKAALDEAGRPTPALLKFAEKRGVPPERLVRVHDGRQEVFAQRERVRGERLDRRLAARVAQGLKELPAPKRMRWGAGEAEFVRPIHGLVMLHGARVVPGEVLGVRSSRLTAGHRFLAARPIALARADDYERELRARGRVIADFERRRAEIVRQLERAASGARLVADDALLDEIAALVEWPAVYPGRFDPAFLEVPEECLVLSMQQHQRYVPLRDGKSGKLLPRFLFVSNVPARRPREIVHGNERVLAARLADAKFFYDQDRKTRLEARVPRLASVVFHSRLGSQLERVERLRRLAGEIARELGADAQLAERAAWLAKADLVTEMVGEFPELQGVMGRYYALHDGEPPAVAEAIESHYRPRFAGDRLPEGELACAVALADKLDTLAGIFGIGLAPTGEKDPFALRRAALGAVRILAERALPLALDALLARAFANYPPGRIESGAQAALREFVLDRLRGYLRERGFDPDEIEAVVAQDAARLDRVVARLAAVRAFRKLPEASALAAANKRIRNILRQATEAIPPEPDPARLAEEAEKVLNGRLGALEPEVEARIARGDYSEALHAMARLRPDVDRFFDQVLVMAEDAELRRNRLALLARLNELMNRVADLSKLAA